MIIDNITLKNEYLTVILSAYGAEMTSIKTADGEEHLHQKDSIFWNRQAPVLFPVTGGVIGDKININGKSYDMPKHGFAMNTVFNLMECSEDIAVFSLLSNEETKKMYPYDFELLITYKLLGKSIDVSYEVINDGEDTMYFSIGSHEGYMCLDGLDNYEIQFEKCEDDPYYFEDESEKINSFSKSGDGSASVLKLSDRLFDGGRTVVFEKPKSEYVILKNNTDDSKIRVEFGEFDNLFIWSKPWGQFVCIEPWCGTAEKDFAAKDISEKPYIQSLDGGVHFEKHHIITIY